MFLYYSLNDRGFISTFKLKNLFWVQEYGKKLFKLSNFDYPIKKSEELLNKKLPTKIEDFVNINFNPQHIYEFQSPSLKKNYLNDIGNVINLERDVYIAGKIINLLSKNNGIFAVFGHNHVVAQEPAYQKFFIK